MNAIEGILFREAGAPQGTPPLVLFFQETAVKDERASKDGPPIFDRVVQVKVVVAGMRDEGPIYEVERTKADGSVKIDQAAYRRFSKPFEEWKTGQAPSNAGTPLEQWPLMDVAMVATLKASHVYTVQQLAELSDAALEASFRRGGREWRSKAQTWLTDATTAAGDAEARAENAKLREQMEQMQGQITELLRKQNGLGFDKPRSRARRAVSDDDMIIDVVEPDEGDRRL